MQAHVSNQRDLVTQNLRVIIVRRVEVEDCVGDDSRLVVELIQDTFDNTILTLLVMCICSRRISYFIQERKQLLHDDNLLLASPAHGASAQIVAVEHHGADQVGKLGSLEQHFVHEFGVGVGEFLQEVNEGLPLFLLALVGRRHSLEPVGVLGALAQAVDVATDDAGYLDLFGVEEDLASGFGLLSDE